MRIMVLRSNPRKDGYTQLITDLVVQGANEAGAEIEDIDLLQKKIHQCRGCYHCWTEIPGTCIHNDDMAGLLESILAADILLCSTPLYNYTMSSSMKIFFERILPLMKPGFEKNPKGLLRNYLRYPGKWNNKKLAFICAGAFKKRANFDGILSTFKLLADGMHMTFSSGLLRPESFLLQFSFAKPKTVKTVETALIQSGSELARKGIVSEKNIQNVSIPLSTDIDHFKKYSNIYWEHATSMKLKDEAGLKKIRYEVSHDVRILMHEMAGLIDPLATAKLKATFQFDFPDKDFHYCIKVNKGTCTIEETQSQSFDLRVTADSATWAKVFTCEIPAREALQRKEIILEGEKMLFTRLGRYFPPPES
jgi:multimeric flavodoxin WrbA